MRRPLALLALAALSGCANTPGACDPSQAGFFSGISCQTSGAYGARDATLRDNLSTARANLASDRARADAASADAGAAQAEQARAAGALSSLRRQNAAIRARLDAASRRQGADQAAISQQRSQLEQLERQRAAAQRDGASPAALSDIKRQQDAILQAVDRY